MDRRQIIKYFQVLIAAATLVICVFAALCVFFDEAVLVRKGAIFHVNTSQKLVALTFDDGPSPVWTPQLLDKLKEKHAKATFFMIGKHAEEYPDIARRVAAEGHEIGNHTYDHHGIFFYTKEELNKEVLAAEEVIRSITGVSTVYFRPPKAWITDDEKKWLNEEGYRTVLWTLNSKDWVQFDDKYILKYLLKRVKPGDILLFHDSGGVFDINNGDRHETVKTIPRLIDELRKRGYQFVTVSELIEKSGN